ncbi:MAG TPA: acyl-CoA dehydrogenase family protein, partial [Geothrix sp.]|nr:acyl-CoA dehydrogenase family protein [Geothrix sp.]
MDVTLPEHVEALRQEVRRFAEKEIRPHVMAWDEAKTFPMGVVKQLGGMGMMGVIFPEDYGGAGMGYLGYAVVVEELSRVDGSVGITVAAHNSLCSNHIYAMGDERQKQAWLKPLASGKAIGAWGLTEPGSGS